MRKIRVDRAKGHVSCDETWSFTQRNLTFRAPKPYLSQFRILQTARLQFKIRVTICQPTFYKKPQKSTFFRPSDPFVRSDALYLGLKFEYYLTKSRSPEFKIRMYRPQTFAMPISNNCSAECAPERGNEPPARGNALGNKGNITNSIHRQGQMPEASDKGSQPYRNAYGISSLAPQHINQTPTVFLPLQHITKSNA